MPHPRTGRPTFEELRSVPDEKLIKWIDQNLAQHNEPRILLDTQIFINEPTRREQDRATQAMLGYYVPFLGGGDNRRTLPQFMLGPFLPSPAGREFLWG